MTLLRVCGVDLFMPELEHLIENPFHGPFSKKKPLKSDSWIQIHEMKLSSTSSALVLFRFCGKNSRTWQVRTPLARSSRNPCTVHWFPNIGLIKQSNTHTHHFVNWTCLWCLSILMFKHSEIRKFVFLRLHFSSHQMSIVGMLYDSVRRFRATLLLRATCMRLWGNWVASCVAALNQKPKACYCAFLM